MAEEQTGMNTTGEGTPRWVGLALIVLAGISLVGLGVGWNALTHAKGSEQALAEQNKDLQQNVDMLNRRLAQAEQSSAEVQTEMNTVADHLKLTQGQLASTRQQTKQISSDYSQKLDNVQNQLATKANADDVTALGGDVNGVKSGLDTTNNNLQMARGELGTLIAKNHDEIDELRRLGERDYYEFTLTGKGNKSKAGSLMIELRGTNPKKNQFTVDLTVNDMRLEKKNRSVDEPIYFYTQGTRAPLELVVNQVGKDKVVGYVSVPKMQPAGANSASSTGTGE
jgi:predicted  nucleic acid-binding Zn-ribbon protein